MLARSDTVVPRPLRTIFGEHVLQAYVYAQGPKKKIALRPIDVIVGNGADPGVFIFVMRDEQYAIVLAGVDGESDRHAREDDNVVQWHQEQSTHQEFTFASCLPKISRRIASRRLAFALI